MARYEIVLREELDVKLRAIAEAAGVDVADMIQDFLDDHLMSAQTDLIVRQYKNGNLPATKAWKLSGLTFDEFMAMAKE
ncbi:MAG: hypothetical protein ACXAE3_10820 [Candidatus Kariarchaeaceae archaeon]